MARRRNEIVPETSSRFGPGPHQLAPETTSPKRNERDRTRAKMPQKSTKPIVIPSLITAWLLVRVLPHTSGNRPRQIFD
jgi:hypothetical protein